MEEQIDQVAEREEADHTGASVGAAGSRARHGEYQIGDDHARSWIVRGSPSGGFSPARIASHVVQRQVGFSNTRT